MQPSLPHGSWLPSSGSSESAVVVGYGHVKHEHCLLAGDW